MSTRPDDCTCFSFTMTVPTGKRPPVVIAFALILFTQTVMDLCMWGSDARLAFSARVGPRQRPSRRELIGAGVGFTFVHVWKSPMPGVGWLTPFWTAVTATQRTTSAKIGNACVGPMHV